MGQSIDFFHAYWLMDVEGYSIVVVSGLCIQRTLVADPGSSPVTVELDERVSLTLRSLPTPLSY